MDQSLLEILFREEDVVEVVHDGEHFDIAPARAHNPVDFTPQLGEAVRALGLAEMFADPEVLKVADQALADMETYFVALVSERRASPRDDLTSALAVAEIDGDRLSPEELQLVVEGVNEVIGD